MHHCSFNIIQVSVMLQRPLQEACFLTQLRHVSAIIVGEHLVTQNGICNLQQMAHRQALSHTDTQIQTGL